MKWFKDGDKNTRFFHNYVKGRRKKLKLIEIQTGQGDVINNSENIWTEAVMYFEDQFKEEICQEGDEMLEVIPKLISAEQNVELSRPSSIEEVKEVVFELNGDSASGPDGFLGEFFQSCWDSRGGHLQNGCSLF